MGWICGIGSFYFLNDTENNLVLTHVTEQMVASKAFCFISKQMQGAQHYKCKMSVLSREFLNNMKCLTHALYLLSFYLTRNNGSH